MEVPGEAELGGCRSERPGGRRRLHLEEVLVERDPQSQISQALHGCPAKKQVQRSDDDPLAYDVTYHEDHTGLQQPREEELEQGDAMQRDQEQSAAA
ncbi:WRKY transcription factor 55-like [Zingiber officinale]|uniref:WRKY transcription factor 55-like n=1 Tax=Zingiber officinale TaxID=94328 RepID=UPI001C4B1BCC|nr:WRKY transcription factor 55-like [Zingiber officinale]